MDYQRKFAKYPKKRLAPRLPVRRKLATKSYVKKEMAKASEMKSHDTTISSSVALSGSVTHISAIPQGDTSVSRDGDVVTIKSLHMRYSIAGADATNIVRWIIFRDDESIGITPSVGNVLQTASVLEYLEVNNKRRFYVLGTGICATTENGPNAYAGEWNRKISFKTTFAGTALTGRNNAIYLLLISDSAAISHPTFNASCRIKFVDS